MLRSDSLPRSRKNWNVPSRVPADKRDPYHYASNADTVLHTYLERQGRNEYINLAFQMGYDGSNLAFVFYENQVRRLMDESLYDSGSQTCRKYRTQQVSCKHTSNP